MPHPRCSFHPSPCDQGSYAVLAHLSASYSPLEGRLPMYSSPVRRFTSVLLRLLARLACIRRAASVRSEPGSNSQKRFYWNWTRGPPFQYTLPCSLLTLFSCQRTVAFITRAVQFTTHGQPCQVATKKFLIGCFLRIRCDVSVSRSATRQDQKRSSK